MADTYKTIECPACGKTMKKIFIPSAGISVDICANSCGGIFFDNQELQKFDNSSEDVSLIKNELEGKNFIRVDESKTRICPACGKPMAKTSIKGAGIEIDSCYNCGGIFLDNGELDYVRRGVATSSEVRNLSTQQPQTSRQPVDMDYVRQVYREAQMEQAQKATQNDLISSALFGRRYSYGLLDFIFDIFR